MFKISYKEYLIYEMLYSKKIVLEVREDEEEYNYDKNNEHDKVIRDVLMIKEEALKLINNALKTKKEIKEEIELYNNRFITSKYKERESDIVYKVKNKDVFFLIEHQSTIDYTITYRMMEYSIEIMRTIIKGRENKKKEYRYPLIIPIVVYTGDKKWNAKLNIKDITQKVEWYEEKDKINLIDINKYTNDELLEEDNILSKVMLLERSKNKIEFIKNVEEILQKADDKSLIKLKEIIRYKAIGIVKENEIEEILRKVKQKKEEKEMTLAERIERNEREEKIRIANKAMQNGIKEGMKEGRKEGRKEGIKESINKTIIKMLNLKMDENIIKEITGVKDKELEKVKKKLLEV